MEINELFKKLHNGDRRSLAKAITLVESTRQEDTEKAKKLISLAIKHSGNSLRLGVTGRPGAGKSTFIETIGLKLIDQGHKVAVLAVDPSSPVNKGSLLGDKTRMENLSIHENSFIRPSSSGGILGGVSRRTRELTILCEAAGYDRIIIETVGVGQSEALISDMVDLLLMLELPFAGDEVQFIKKGLSELIDIFIVHKYDGERMDACEQTAHGLRNSFTYGHKNTLKKVICLSSYTNEGYEELFKTINDFIDNQNKSEKFTEKRNSQLKNWFDTELKLSFETKLLEILSNSQDLKEIQKQVYKSAVSPVEGASLIINKVMTSE